MSSWGSYNSSRVLFSQSIYHISHFKIYLSTYYSIILFPLSLVYLYKYIFHLFLYIHINFSICFAFIYLFPICFQYMLLSVLNCSFSRLNLIVNEKSTGRHMIRLVHVKTIVRTNLLFLLYNAMQYAFSELSDPPLPKALVCNTF